MFFISNCVYFMYFFVDLTTFMHVCIISCKGRACRRTPSNSEASFHLLRGPANTGREARDSEVRGKTLYQSARP